MSKEIVEAVQTLEKEKGISSEKLMLALEDGFEIEFPDSMLSRKTFGSIASLAAAVEQLAGRTVSV